ncbi:hypothetical protein WBG06_00425 [Nocardioides sp. CCNWLW239]|uniref:TRAFAC clade GTPase domain-containing protein n=1 Tax=Nocardioides sp. CCNWLW239 TaxID=3128902 RepID=UPI0030170B76
MPLDVKEQDIAVFGESGSGKTVLVSSFFGPTTDPASSNDLWDLIADNAGQGARLTQNYLGMKNSSRTPPATRFASTTYSFTLRLTGGQRNQRLQGLRLGWHDYPGEWFHEDPSSEEENTRRVETFRSLLGSDVAFLLVDGQKLLDHKGEEKRYLRALFSNFRQGMLRLQDEIVGDGGPLTRFPRIWIVALSKADLFPDWDVHAFHDLVIENAGDDLAKFLEAIKPMVAAPEALSVGEDFILLSSAKFEIAAAGPEPVEIDVQKQVGLDLILPVAFMLPLERIALWMEQTHIPTTLLRAFSEGAGGFANLLTENKHVVEAVLSMIPRIGPFPPGRRPPRSSRRPSSSMTISKRRTPAHVRLGTT